MPRRPVCHPSLDTFPVLSLSLSVFDSVFLFLTLLDSYLNTFMFEGFTILCNSSEEWSFFFHSLFLPECPKMYWEMDVVCDEMCSSSRLRMNGHSTFGYWSLYHKGQIKNIWNGNSNRKEKVGKRMKSNSLPEGDKFANSLFLCIDRCHSEDLVEVWKVKQREREIERNEKLEVYCFLETYEKILSLFCLVLNIPSLFCLFK